MNQKHWGRPKHAFQVGQAVQVNDRIVGKGRGVIVAVFGEWIKVQMLEGLHAAPRNPITIHFAEMEAA